MNSLSEYQRKKYIQSYRYRQPSTFRRSYNPYSNFITQQRMTPSQRYSLYSRARERAAYARAPANRSRQTTKPPTQQRMTSSQARYSSYARPSNRSRRSTYSWRTSPFSIRSPEYTRVRAAALARARARADANRRRMITRTRKPPVPTAPRKPPVPTAPRKPPVPTAPVAPRKPPVPRVPPRPQPRAPQRMTSSQARAAYIARVRAAADARRRQPTVPQRMVPSHAGASSPGYRGRVNSMRQPSYSWRRPTYSTRTAEFRARAAARAREAAIARSNNVRTRMLNTSRNMNQINKTSEGFENSNGNGNMILLLIILLIILWNCF